MNSGKLRSSFSRQNTSESERSTSSCRPETRDHMLTWYIPRFIASSRGVTCNTNHLKKITQTACGERQEEALSPLHNNSKQIWDKFYSDEKIRSLPIPPPYQPKIYEHDPPHANNITNIFKSSNYPASVLYSRYGIPLFPIHAQFDTAHKSDMVWLNKPLQSMFAHVGAVPRRHFTVAPDWRHLSKNNS